MGERSNRRDGIGWTGDFVDRAAQPDLHGTLERDGARSGTWSNLQTEELIEVLAADPGRSQVTPRHALLLALGAAICVAGAGLLATLGIRPDFADALMTVRFPFKFVVTMTVAASAFVLLQRSLYPGFHRRVSSAVLLPGPLLLLAAANAELFLVPPDQWLSSAVGQNSMLCLSAIPSLGAVPLAIFIAALRQGAPTRPEVAGALAGTLAGAIAATFYAAQCTDDSPLFVASWYPIAIGMLGASGASAGRFFIKW